jgi:hypothetical protein
LFEKIFFDRRDRDRPNDAVFAAKIIEKNQYVVYRKKMKEKKKDR